MEKRHIYRDQYINKEVKKADIETIKNELETYIPERLVGLVDDVKKYEKNIGYDEVDLLYYGPKKIRKDEISKNFKHLDSYQLQNAKEIISGDLINEPLVFCSLSAINHTLYVEQMEITPWLQRKGIGKELYAEIEKVGKKAGFSTIAGMHGDHEIARYFLEQGRFFIEELDENIHQEEYKLLIDEYNDSKIIPKVQFQLVTIKPLEGKIVLKDGIKDRDIDTRIANLLEKRIKLLTQRIANGNNEQIAKMAKIYLQKEEIEHRIIDLKNNSISDLFSIYDALWSRVEEIEEGMGEE